MPVAPPPPGLDYPDILPNIFVKFFPNLLKILAWVSGGSGSNPGRAKSVLDGTADASCRSPRTR